MQLTELLTLDAVCPPVIDATQREVVEIDGIAPYAQAFDAMRYFGVKFKLDGDGGVYWLPEIENAELADYVALNHAYLVAYLEENRVIYQWLMQIGCDSDDVKWIFSTRYNRACAYWQAVGGVPDGYDGEVLIASD